MCAQESDRSSVTVNESLDSFENDASDKSVNCAYSLREIFNRDECNILTV